MTTDLRPCRVVVPGPVESVVAVEAAYFHRFTDTGCAVLELPDGTIKIVAGYMVQFTDRGAQ